jgi:hypothetical protein
MKTKSLFLLLILFTSKFLFGQGTNNDFKYDEKDFNNLFNELGITTFKFPIKQNTNQVLDFAIEEYINGKLISAKSIIDYTKDQFKQYGLDPINYFKAKKDSIYLHRFYFIKRDTSLEIKVNTQGVTAKHTINTLGKSTYDLRAQFEIKSEIDSLGYLEGNKSKDLLFLYANAPESKEPLWCPAGMPRDIVIKKFYHVIFITVKDY